MQKKQVRPPEKISDKTKTLFIEYIGAKGWGVFNDAFMGTHYFMREPKRGENIHDFYYNDILTSNLDNIGIPERFLSFIEDCLKKGEREVALSQAIKKTPGAKNYQYETHVKNIVKTLTPYKSSLFNYVARTKFLENSWNLIENVFLTIDDQPSRVGIIEAMINTKTFNSIDTQKSIYNIVQKHIRNPKIFDKHFSKIEKIDEQQTVVDFINTPSVVMIGFKAEKIMGANLSSEIRKDTLIGQITVISESIYLKYKDIGIIKTIMSYDSDKKQYCLNVICPKDKVELVSFIYEKMINSISRISLYSDLLDFNKEPNLDCFIKKCNSEFLHKTLKKDINENKLTSEKKLKI
jgi:hypothetical protein